LGFPVISSIELAEVKAVARKQIVASPPGEKSQRGGASDPEHIWAVLGWIGLVFLVVGGSDFALTWFPSSFGNREWEFGTVTASFNGLPIVVLGLGFLLMASVQLGRRLWAVLCLVFSVVLLVWVIGGGLLWLRNIPLALEATPVEVVVGIKKALAKTMVQSVSYPVVLILLAVRSYQAVNGRGTRSS